MGDRARQRLRDVGGAQADDLDLSLEVGEVDPVVEAAALERIVELSGAVRGNDYRGRLIGGDRPELGHGHGVVGEDLEQEGLELVVSAVELVDQEHGSGAGADCAQQRPLEQELGPVELGHPPLGVDLTHLERPRVEKLPRIVPLVERLPGIDPLVALEPDQLRVDDTGQRLADLRLADPGLPLEEQRAAHREGEEDRGREPAVRQIGLAREGTLDVFDGFEQHLRDRMGAARTSR